MRIIKSLTPFLRLGRRSAEYGQAYRAGTKSCVTWLENRADELDGGSKQDRLRATALRQAAADMAREAKDIAFDGAEVESEGPFFDALRDLQARMRGSIS